MRKLRTGSAPGHPGAKANWASSRKSAVGRSVDPQSHVWFTIGDGVLNEVYYPRADLPCTKDLGLIITDGESFFSEERRDTDSKVHWAGAGIPAFRLTNTHKGGRYRIHKEILTDPRGHVVFQRTRFEPLTGTLSDYRLFALAAPHLGDHGLHNTACVGAFKGTPMLMAESRECGLALACSTGWLARSVGFVGKSDGWQDLSRHFHLTWHYDHAADGNVALTGEIHLPEDGRFTLLLGLGRGTDDACSRVHAALFQNFDALWQEYVRGWEEWQSKLLPLDKMDAGNRDLFRASAAVLRIHGDEAFPGARVASLSVPWGEARTQEMSSGYHAVWARDAAQSALGLLACGVKEEVRQTLVYLQSVQEADGHWPQSMWVDGSAYWNAIQIDSIAAPVLLYEISRQEGVLDKDQAAALWPMVRRAAIFICRNGPVTEQDRWERTGGFSPYTLATAIAALVIAAHAAQDHGDSILAAYLFDTADAWNAQIENWTWCEGSKLARSLDLPGYYARLIPASEKGEPQRAGTYSLANSATQVKVEAAEIVSPDVWGLVRYGLRAPDDARVAATTRAVDATLRTHTPRGPIWRRYNHDGYGEDADGAAYCEKGIGRSWPLFDGERGHQELARGQKEEALQLLATMERLAGSEHLLPEQVWDRDDLPDRRLFLGHPSGSARPLAWAHAEHLQLLRSLADQRVFSCPTIVANRYVRDRAAARHTIWRPNLQCDSTLPNTKLRIEASGPFQVRWEEGNLEEVGSSLPGPAGLHYLDLPISGEPPSRRFVIETREASSGGPVYHIRFEDS